MIDPLDERIRELGWRQRLTKADETELQAYLAKHPEARDALAVEAQLTRLLEETPEAPKVASNFTAQVMLAIEREQAVERRKAAVTGGNWRWLHRWLPRTAVAAIAVGICLIGVRQHQLRQRALMAERVEQVARVLSAVGQEPVEHFAQIQRISDAPAPADTDLSALMASLQ